MEQLCCTVTFSRQQQTAIRDVVHRPTNLPDCKKIVCHGERRAQRLADNRGRSTGWPEIRQPPPLEWNDPLANVFQFRLRLLLAAAQT